MMATRMRKAGYKTQGVHVSVLYRNGCHWHMGRSTGSSLVYVGDIYKFAYKLLRRSPYRYPVHTLAVSCFSLSKLGTGQLELFEDPLQRERLAEAIDTINEKWGDFVITPAKMLGTNDVVIDRIAFGLPGV